MTNDGAAEDLATGRRALICAHLLASVETCFPFDLSGSVFQTAASVEGWIETAMAAPDRKAFARVCQSGLASLGNGHSSYHDSRVMTSGSLGFHACPLGNSGWVVTTSHRRDVAVGSTLAAIDGVPIVAVFDRIAPLISASRTANAAASAFYNDWLLPEDAVLTLADGVDVPLRRQESAAMIAPHRQTFRNLDDGIGLLTVPDFGPDGTDAALADLDAARACRTLIVDVRGNGGGNTPMPLIRALHPGPIPLWQESSTLISGLDRAHRERADRAWPPSGSVIWPAEAETGDNDAFAGDMVILQDALTCSAAEDFVMPFKTTGRARIMGETSAGSTGQPYFERINDDIRFRVAAKRVLWPDGTLFEGAGIVPDTTISPDVDDLASGRDPVLAAAVDLLGARATRSI